MRCMFSTPSKVYSNDGATDSWFLSWMRSRRLESLLSMSVTKRNGATMTAKSSSGNRLRTSLGTPSSGFLTRMETLWSFLTIFANSSGFFWKSAARASLVAQALRRIALRAFGYFRLAGSSFESHRISIPWDSLTSSMNDAAEFDDFSATCMIRIRAIETSAPTFSTCSVEMIPMT